MAHPNQSIHCCSATASTFWHILVLIMWLTVLSLDPHSASACQCHPLLYWMKAVFPERTFPASWRSRSQILFLFLRFRDLFEQRTTGSLLQIQETSQLLQAKYVCVCVWRCGWTVFWMCLLTSNISRWGWVVSDPAAVVSACLSDDWCEAERWGGQVLDAMCDWVSLLKLDIRADGERVRSGWWRRRVFYFFVCWFFWHLSDGVSNGEKCDTF